MAGTGIQVPAMHATGQFFQHEQPVTFRRTGNARQGLKFAGAVAPLAQRVDRCAPRAKAWHVVSAGIGHQEVLMAIHGYRYHADKKMAWQDKVQGQPQHVLAPHLRDSYQVDGTTQRECQATQRERQD
ncbi:hypothetical protein [Rhodothermus profundi]|uniref:hypothetical protein n=1 Tax=Rhodothermus profundi TaxID=633813 RepID=UPI000932DDAA|nr:hypothetical protein [Rhodothermus profundi]